MIPSEWLIVAFFGGIWVGSWLTVAKYQELLDRKNYKIDRK